MKTKLGKEISETTRGIVYLCSYDRQENTIKVRHELFFDSSSEALETYANIPNPESQIVMGKDYEKLCSALETLHKCMEDKDWLTQLGECI